MLSHYRLALLCLLVVLPMLPASPQSSDQLQVGPPPLHRAEPPAAGATAEQLENEGDQLRGDKNFLDAVDYYEAALKKSANGAVLFNKIGMSQLGLQRYREAEKSFGRAIRADRTRANAYNNLGVVYYLQKNYGKALKQYSKAIALEGDAASFYSNRGAAYFSKKQFDKAAVDYSKAMELDPDIFERVSRSGVMAQLASPEDRAHYDYVLAKLYAKMGVPERSLHYLKKAMEEGYKDIKDVYKDNEFTELRKDPRFAELMAAKPASIPD
jgi:tetratricopeptide (TPR) repeat protein